MAGATDRADLAQTATAAACDATAASGAYIERIISRDDGVEIIASTGPGVPPRGTRSKFPGSLTDALIQRDIPGLVIAGEDVRDELLANIVSRCPQCSLLAVPLRGGPEVFGSLGLLRAPGQEPFQSVDIDRAATVADAIAVAMERVTNLAREREARAQLTRTIESITDGFISVDRDLRVLFTNPAARRTLGIDASADGAALVGRPLAELLPPAVRSRLEEEARRAMVEQQPLRFEQHIGPPDRWFDVSAHPSPDQLSIFFRDITDSKRAELALRRSERRQAILADTGQLLEAMLGFQATLDRLAHLLVRWLCDWSAIYLPVAGGARRAALAGRDPDTEVLARRAIGEVHPESLETPTMRVLRTARPILLADVPETMVDIAASQSADYARLLHEHTPRSIINVPLVARGHAIAAMALVSTDANRRFTEDDLSLAEEIARRAALALDSAKLYEDATQRALAESALRKAAAAVTARLSVDPVIQEIARNALLALDAAGAFVERVDEKSGQAVVVGTAGERVPPNGASTPYDGSFARHVVEHGQPERIPDLGAPDRLVPRVLTTRCRGCPALVVPLLREEARGALFFIRAPGGAEFGDDEVERGAIFGELAGLAFRKAYLLELAERRRADAEAAARARDEVLAVVSHDLRNPLHTIAMAASLLDNTSVALDAKEHHEHCLIIKRSSDRMSRLIQDLLDASRIEAQRFTVKCECESPLPIAEEAFEAFRPMAEARGLRLRREVHDGTGPVYIDRDRIMQVLTNFLDNALKFTPAGSEIVLTLDRDPDQAGIRFVVRDQGPGIAPDALPHVFDRYWQNRSTAHKGAGLGLTIAKGIAEAHGGRVWAESVVGQGSTFNLWLPFSPRCLGLENVQQVGRGDR
jgi:PAS domain S-box-containing protein